MKLLLYSFSFLLLFQISCSKENVSLNQGATEVFDSISRPFFAYNSEKDEYMLSHGITI